MQPSCVQVAVSAVNVPADVCATRKLPDEVCTSAAPPTGLSGELASIVSVAAPPTTPALTVGSCGTSLGLVELPPQAGSRPASDSSVSAWPALTQNSRRVRVSLGMRAEFATAVPGPRSMRQAVNEVIDT